MLVKPTTTKIYGFGSEVQVSVNPQQKWEVSRDKDNIVVLEKNDTFLVLNKKEFENEWEAV